MLSRLPINTQHSKQKPERNLYIHYIINLSTTHKKKIEYDKQLVPIEVNNVNFNATTYAEKPMNRYKQY